MKYRIRWENKWGYGDFKWVSNKRRWNSVDTYSVGAVSDIKIEVLVSETHIPIRKGALIGSGALNRIITVYLWLYPTWNRYVGFEYCEYLDILQCIVEILSRWGSTWFATRTVKARVRFFFVSLFQKRNSSIFSYAGSLRFRVYLKVYLFSSFSEIREQISFRCKLHDEEIWRGLGTTANQTHDVLVWTNSFHQDNFFYEIVHLIRSGIVWKVKAWKARSKTANLHVLITY